MCIRDRYIAFKAGWSTYIEPFFLDISSENLHYQHLLHLDTSIKSCCHKNTSWKLRLETFQLPHRCPRFVANFSSVCRQCLLLDCQLLCTGTRFSRKFSIQIRPPHESHWFQSIGHFFTRKVSHINYSKFISLWIYIYNSFFSQRRFFSEIFLSLLPVS